MAKRWEGNIGSTPEGNFGKFVEGVDYWDSFPQPLFYIDTAPKKISNQRQIFEPTASQF
jgi:hypothetical protein